MRIGGGRSSRNVEDRRDQRPSRGGGAVNAGAALYLVRFLFSPTGRRLVAPLVLVAVLASVVFGPQRVIGFVMALLSGGAAVGPSGPALTPEEDAQMAEFSRAVLATTEEVWTDLYAAAGHTYTPPKLVLYRDGTTTGCGFGQAAMGPFYCPRPERAGEPPAIYIDLSFFKLMAERMNAGGDFAQAYVIAHEVGHHIQNIEGVLDWSMRAKRAAGSDAGANEIQVRVELMADCYAGVWARHAGRLSEVEIERGDIEEAVGAAEAVGDDTIQRRATGRVVPDAFTHGTAAQRVRWLRRGLESGDPDVCETREMPYERL